MNKTYSYNSWHVKLNEVEEQEFPQVRRTLSLMRRMRPLLEYLRNKERRSKYEEFVDHMAKFKTALLIPIAGFDDYSESAHILKEVESGVSEGIRSAEEEYERRRW